MTPLTISLHHAHSAVISECGQYRYRLTREWDQQIDEHSEPLVFLMLNPSTADATIDDPTIRRCIGFAKREGYRALAVVNLFAFRSTSPRDMFMAQDPIGPDNERYIRETCAVRKVVAAWGATVGIMPPSRGRAYVKLVREILAEVGADVCHLGLTKNGHPKHPLYLASDAPLTAWETT